MNHNSPPMIAQASPERYIPELENPMFRIVVSFAGKSNLANVVNSLSIAEVREMAEYVEGMAEDTRQVFLAFDAEVPEDSGFRKCVGVSVVNGNSGKKPSPRSKSLQAVR